MCTCVYWFYFHNKKKSCFFLLFYERTQLEDDSVAWEWEFVPLVNDSDREEGFGFVLLT